MRVNVFRHRLQWPIVCGLVVIVGCTSSTGEAPPGKQLPTNPQNAQIDTPNVQIDLKEPTKTTPAVFGATVVPAEAKVGETVTFVVQAAMADGWHIYAADRESPPSVPTSLELILPAGLEAVDQWIYPEAKEYTTELGKSYAYEGRVSFYHRLVVTDGASGTTPIRCNLKYQSCTDAICHRPMDGELVATLNVARQ